MKTGDRAREIAASPTKSLVVLLVNIAAMAALICLLDLFMTAQHAAGNELAVGPAAKLNTPLPVPINRPLDLNFKTREEVLSLRRQIVLQNANLLTGAYEPDMDIFGEIQDFRPWWGTRGGGPIDEQDPPRRAE